MARGATTYSTQNDVQAFFDPAFQRHVIASFLEAELGAGCDCLKEEYFEDEITGDIAEFVRDFYILNKESPTKEALIQNVKEGGTKPGRKLTEYLENIEDIYEKIGYNGAYYRSKLSDFVHAKKLGHALKESYRLLEQGSMEEALKEIQSRALTNGSLEGKIIDFWQRVEERAKEYFDIAAGAGNEKRIGSGFHLLDERMRGGLGAGEIGVILAPSGHGKTTALVSFAANCLLHQKKVLYVTLELSDAFIQSKFDTNLYGMTYEEIKKKPKTFRDSMQRLRGELSGSNLQIIEFATDTLTLHRLEELVERTAPEIVFIDYAELLKPLHSKEETRFELAALFRGLRGVAGRCKVPIWTAHQANRPALDAKEIGMKNVSESFAVVGIVDALISLNQTDSERRQGILRMHVAKNRLGGSGDTFEARVNWGLSRIHSGVERGELENS